MLYLVWKIAENHKNLFPIDSKFSGLYIYIFYDILLAHRILNQRGQSYRFPLHYIYSFIWGFGHWCGAAWLWPWWGRDPTIENQWCLGSVLLCEPRSEWFGSEQLCLMLSPMAVVRDATWFWSTHADTMMTCWLRSKGSINYVWGLYRSQIKLFRGLRGHGKTAFINQIDHYIHSKQLFSWSWMTI